MARTLRMLIDGERRMHCAGCASSVEYALLRLEGVRQVEADLKTQIIKVESESELDIDHIVDELHNLGYSVREGG